jgi:hypothetical protein
MAKSLKESLKAAGSMLAGRLALWYVMFRRPKRIKLVTKVTLQRWRNDRELTKRLDAKKADRLDRLKHPEKYQGK